MGWSAFGSGMSGISETSRLGANRMRGVRPSALGASIFGVAATAGVSRPDVALPVSEAATARGMQTKANSRAERFNGGPLEQRAGESAQPYFRHLSAKPGCGPAQVERTVREAICLLRGRG